VNQKAFHPEWRFPAAQFAKPKDNLI